MTSVLSSIDVDNCDDFNVIKIGSSSCSVFDLIIVIISTGKKDLQSTVSADTYTFYPVNF